MYVEVLAAPSRRSGFSPGASAGSRCQATSETADNNDHYPKYDDNVSFQGLLKFAPT